MKTFIIGGRKESKYHDLNNLIADTLSELGVAVDRSLIDSERESDSKDLESTYRRNLSSIKSSDFVVIEATELSSGIGFLIGLSLNEKKPTIVLNHGSDVENFSLNIKSGSHNNRLLTLKPYSETNLKKIFTDYIQSVKGILDTKFILIIPAEIDRYLEWASSEKRMHKAQIVREAIENVMEGDKEWKEYQKSA